jgi:hypothetical protein
MNSVQGPENRIFKDLLMNSVQGPENRIFKDFKWFFCAAPFRS